VPVTLIGRDGKPLTSIRNLDADAIVREFIQDAVNYFPTNLQRFVAGLERIAEVRGVTVELATQHLFAEYTDLTGRPFPTAVA
jgi:hypothetical protein